MRLNSIHAYRKLTNSTKPSPLHLQQAEALRQSILKKAFSGQLVPQDPNDEPASALLARIKTERATAKENLAVRPKSKRG